MYTGIARDIEICIFKVMLFCLLYHLWIISRNSTVKLVYTYTVHVFPARACKLWIYIYMLEGCPRICTVQPRGCMDFYALIMMMFYCHIIHGVIYTGMYRYMPVDMLIRRVWLTGVFRYRRLSVCGYTRPISHIKLSSTGILYRYSFIVQVYCIVSTVCVFMSFIMLLSCPSHYVTQIVMNVRHACYFTSGSV